MESPIARCRNEVGENLDYGDFWREPNIIHASESCCTGLPDGRFPPGKPQTGRFLALILRGLFQCRAGFLLQRERCDQPARLPFPLKLRGLEFCEDGKRPP